MFTDFMLKTFLFRFEWEEFQTHGRLGSLQRMFSSAWRWKEVFVDQLWSYLL